MATADPVCAFSHWDITCVFSAGHEGPHCPGFYPHDDHPEQCVCGAVEAAHPSVVGPSSGSPSQANGG